MVAKAQEQSRGRGPQQPMPNQNTTGGETASEIGMDVLTQKTKEDAYAQLEQKNKETRNMTREPNLNPGAANEEGQWASVEVAEKERQDILVQQERAERDAQNEQMYQATQLAQRGASRGPQGLTSNPNIGGGATAAEESQWAQAEADEAKRQALQNYVSNPSVGYEKSKNEKAKEIEAKLNNEKPQLASTSSDVSHSKPNESSKQNKKANPSFFSSHPCSGQCYYTLPNPLAPPHPSTTAI